MSQLGILFMRLLAHLPLPWIRGLGTLLGWFLYLVVVPRRHVVKVNLELCFPQWTASRRRAVSIQVFVAVAQAWLDRSWLWHAKPQVVQDRLKVTGATHELDGSQPTVIFAPHFVGMDAGWTALTQQLRRPFTTIYTDQSDKVVDAWMLAGRRRFGSGQLFGRADGIKAIVSALREGAPLYLLPDMNFGPEESVFVPFCGVPAATVPSLSRFAKLGGAKVVPAITRLTSQGYQLQVLAAWKDFPSADLMADTALMNQRLQAYIEAMPEQYYWVHKRFKSRPEGRMAVY